jgi:hypothetical protein
MAQPKSVTFQESDLRMAVRDLAFDMAHFEHYAKTYTSLYSPLHRACYQATIYSLLLHFRILLCFFFSAPQGDDCCVEHFRILPGFDAAFPGSLQTPPLWLPEMRTNLNKRLAHFTATRWKENPKPLDYYAARFGEVLTLIQAFQRALPGEIGMHFSDRLNMWKSQYQQTD